MKSVWIILSREFAARVHRRSFWVATVLVPVLVAALYFLPPFLATRQAKQTHVLVVDDTGLFASQLQDNRRVRFQSVGGTSYARQLMEAGDADLILYVPVRETTIPTDVVLYYQGREPSTTVQADVDHQVQTILRNSILADVHGIDVEAYASIERTRIRMHVQDMSTGRESFSSVKSALAIASSLLVIVALLILGVQLMRSVVEERNNRVSELLAASVRPIHLLWGKIIGVGCSGLLQVSLWTLLSTFAILGVRAAYADVFALAESQQLHHLATKGEAATAQMHSLADRQPISTLVQGLEAIHWPTVIGAVLCAIVLGYILYASCYTMVGSRLGRDSDHNTFAFLTATPLLLSACCLPIIILNPSGPLAVAFSLIPFTAPVALPARIPFGVPWPQLLLSLAIWMLCIPICYRVTATIYRRWLLR